MILNGLRIILTPPAIVLALLSAVTAFLAELLLKVSDLWVDLIRPLSRGYCKRHGHRMGEWLMGWRWCERCGHGERMEKRPAFPGLNALL